MIQTRLIKLINERKTWAFIGSGVSVDSGYPSWEGLVSKLLDRIEVKDSKSLYEDSKFIKAMNEKDFPACFKKIELKISRDKMLGLISELFASVSPTASNLIRCITEFLFNGYITTNYDLLLERNLAQHVKDPWISVGNTDNELPKTTGGCSNIVWHIHGIYNAPLSSRIIITTDDYNALYKKANEIKTHIKSLLEQNTVVFIGFGFKDFDLMYLLESIGLFGNPLRPSYAFMGFSDMKIFHEIADDYLDKFNVHIIPYQIIGKDHSELWRLLSQYQNFALTRNMVFKHGFNNVPYFDPETTSLILYNNLFFNGLNKQYFVSTDKFNTLAKTYILSAICKGRVKREDLYHDLMCRVDINDGQSSCTEFQIYQTYIDDLCNDGLISCSLDGYLDASNTALSLIQTAKTKSDTEKEFFLKVIENRIIGYGSISNSRISDISKCIYNFFVDSLVKQRSLSYIKTLTTSASAKDYNILGVIQSLPEYMENLNSIEEACIMSNVVLDILRDPSEKEKTYLGLCLQSAFSMFALSYNEHVVKEIYNEVSTADYVIDSSLIIQLLATGSQYSQMAQRIVTSLSGFSAKLYTTRNLVKEVIEHLNWVFEKFDTTSIDIETYINYYDYDYQYSNNEFLNGYLVEFEKSKISFNEYITRILSIPFCSPRNVTHGLYDTLTKYNISVLSLKIDKESQTFKDLFEKVKSLRLKYSSYKHDRQVTAEVEVIMALQDGIEIQKDRGLFLSNSRVLDTFIDDRRIVYRPVNVVKLLNIINSFTDVDLSILADLVMLECGVNSRIFDTTIIDRVFNPITRSSESEKPDAIISFKQKFERMYGENPESAFNDLNTIEQIHVKKRTDIQVNLLNDEQIKKAAQKITQSGQTQLSNRQLKKLNAAASKIERRKKKIKSNTKKRRS